MIWFSWSPCWQRTLPNSIIVAAIRRRLAACLYKARTCEMQGLKGGFLCPAGRVQIKYGRVRSLRTEKYAISTSNLIQLQHIIWCKPLPDISKINILDTKTSSASGGLRPLTPAGGSTPAIGSRSRARHGRLLLWTFLGPGEMKLKKKQFWNVLDLFHSCFRFIDMVNKYANPETVLWFAYRFSQPEPTRQNCSPPRTPMTHATPSLYATVSACNKLDYPVCTCRLAPIVVQW